MVRKWKVESAVLHMQKDLAEIKASLSKQTAAPQSPDVPVQPGQSSNVIAQADDSSTSTSA
jgi:hypothetical protein